MIETHIFFNPLFTTKDGKSLNLNKYCKERGIFKFEQLIEEKRKYLAQLPFDKTLTKVLDNISINTQVRKEDVLVTVNGDKIKLNDVTQKILYEETLLRINSQDHHSQAKLVSKLRSPITWEAGRINGELRQVESYRKMESYDEMTS